MSRTTDERIAKAKARIAKAEEGLGRLGREFWHRPIAEAVISLLDRNSEVTRATLLDEIARLYPGGGPIMDHALSEAIERLRNKTGSDKG